MNGDYDFIPFSLLHTWIFQKMINFTLNYYFLKWTIILFKKRAVFSQKPD